MITLIHSTTKEEKTFEYLTDVPKDWDNAVVVMFNLLHEPPQIENDLLPIGHMKLLKPESKFVKAVITGKNIDNKLKLNIQNYLSQQYGINLS